LISCTQIFEFPFDKNDLTFDVTEYRPYYRRIPNYININKSRLRHEKITGEKYNNNRVSTHDRWRSSGLELRNKIKIISKPKDIVTNTRSQFKRNDFYRYQKGRRHKMYNYKGERLQIMAKAKRADFYNETILTNRTITKGLTPADIVTKREKLRPRRFRLLVGTQTTTLWEFGMPKDDELQSFVRTFLRFGSFNTAGEFEKAKSSSKPFHPILLRDSLRLQSWEVEYGRRGRWLW